MFKDLPEGQTHSVNDPMTLQQFIEAKLNEFRQRYRGAGIASEMESFLATALREAAMNTCEAVRVEKSDEKRIEHFIAEGNFTMSGLLCGFNTAVEAMEKKINDYLK